jgi:hypothetical protein
MAKTPKPPAPKAPLTDGDIATCITDYLDNRDDFELELFAYRTLLEHGITARHSGTYVDVATTKARQFDLRAASSIPYHGSALVIRMAIECKSLSREFPLVLSRVPRAKEDSYHQVIRFRAQAGAGTQFRGIHQSPSYASVYPTNDMVAKQTSQIRCDGTPTPASGADRDTYDKWAQALASADELIHLCSFGHRGRVIGVAEEWDLILPVLVVNDGTLWAVDYDHDGNRAPPKIINDSTLFVARSYDFRDGYGGEYSISHVHIFTRSGFAKFCAELARDESLLFAGAFADAIQPLPPPTR